MLAVRVHRFGGPEVLQTERIPIPEPSPMEVLIRTEYAGVNMVDRYYREGWYTPSTRPFTPGLEIGGIVQTVGGEVREFQAGDRVLSVMSPGAYAEYVVAPVTSLVSIPPDLTTEIAVASGIQAFTAYCLCRRTYLVKTRDRVLIHSAANGLGAYLSGLAHRAGALVLGTASSVGKRNRALSAGCDAAFAYEDFVEQVKTWTKGKGVDVVYDSVGATTFLDSLRCLRRRGTLVLCGQSSGPVAAFDPQLLRTYGSLYLTRPSLKDYLEPRADYLELASEVFALLS